VFSKPRQIDTESELYDVAIRALMRRAHSVNEMKKKLERRASSKLLAQVVLARLKESGQLDDTRYAKQFTRQRTEGRKQGKFRVARDLRARGVSDANIEAAIKESSDETTERATIRSRIERKLRSFRGLKTGEKIDDKKLASLYSSLLRAGFPSDAIRRELKSLTREEIPEADAESLSE
jgi:regulatory protein